MDTPGFAAKEDTLALEVEAALDQAPRNRAAVVPQEAAAVVESG
jgi:hypothetical protein